MKKKKNSKAGNRTRVSCVTGRNTNHYTTSEDICVLCGLTGPKSVGAFFLTFFSKNGRTGSRARVKRITTAYANHYTIRPSVVQRTKLGVSFRAVDIDKLCACLFSCCR